MPVWLEIRKESGCGLLPAEGVWRPLAASQMLCLPPHPRVGKNALWQLRPDRGRGRGSGGRLLPVRVFFCPETSPTPPRPPWLGARPCSYPESGTQGLYGGDRGHTARWALCCSLWAAPGGSQRVTGGISRVLLHPADKLLLWNNHPAAHFQYWEARLVHQLVSAGRGHTKNFGHQFCV